jgi:hypothetical protein
LFSQLPSDATCRERRGRQQQYWRTPNGGPWPDFFVQGPPLLGSGFERAEERIGDHPDTDSATEAEAAPRYEPIDVPPFLPFWLAALLAGFVGGVLLFIAIWFPLATHQQYRGPLKALPPAPTLQTAPHRDLRRYEAAKRHELTGRNGRALPIEAAMRETAAQGWGPPK